MAFVAGLFFWLMPLVFAKDTSVLAYMIVLAGMVAYAELGGGIANAIYNGLLEQGKLARVSSRWLTMIGLTAVIFNVAILLGGLVREVI